MQRTRDWRTCHAAVAASAVDSRPVGKRLEDIASDFATTADLSSVKQSFEQLLEEGVVLHPAAYKGPLKVCATGGRPEDARSWMAYMAEKKVQPDASTYDLLVRSHLAAGNIEGAMKSLFEAGKPLMKTCKSVLFSLNGAKDLAGATRLMSSLPALGVQPSYPMYKDMVNLAATVGNVEMAEGWSQQLREDGFTPDAALYVLLIEASAKAKEPEKAIAHFNQMFSADVEMTRAAFVHVILAVAPARDVEVLSEWMERMIDSGFEPTLQCYEAILEAAQSRRDAELQDFWEDFWLKRLQGLKKKPDRDVYNVLIGVPAKYGNVRRAELWLTKMRKAHKEPGTNNWNTVLKGCEVAKDADNAQKLLNRMLNIKKGPKPDATSYNHVIKSCAKAGKPKLAIVWFRRMKEAGLSARGIQFNEVIKATASSATISADYAAEWVALSLEAGYTPSFQAYRSVIQAFLNEKNMDAAQLWLQWMKGNGTTADESIYLDFIRTSPRKVGAWLEKMEEEGVAASAESYNAAIRHFASLGNAKGALAARSWFDRMLEAGISATEETYTQMIAAYARANYTDEAGQWLSKLAATGIRPHMSAYSALMQGYLRAKDPAGVRQILDWAVLEGLTPNAGSYNIAIRAFAEAGDAASAEEMYKRLTVAGRYPDEKTFLFLIQCHARLLDFDRARAWFKEMLSMGVKPTFPIYAAMIRGAAVAGRAEETSEFLEEMSTRRMTSKIDRSAWEAMIVSALRCFDKAGDQEAVERWAEYSEDQGFPDLSPDTKVFIPELQRFGQKRPQKKVVREEARQASATEEVVSDVESGLKMLEELKAEGKTPTIWDFNKVLKAFANSQQPRFSMAKAFLTNTILPVTQPNEITWTLLLRCNRAGDGKRGVFTLESMADMNAAISRRHIDLVLRQLFSDYRSGRIPEIDPLLEKILALLPKKKNPKKLSQTYNQIVAELSDAGQPDLAKEWVSRLRAAGCELQTVQRIKLAQACFLKGDELTALWWLENGLPSGSDPGTVRRNLGMFVDAVTTDGNKAGVGVVAKSGRPNFGFIQLEEPPFKLYFRRRGVVDFDGKLPSPGTRVRFDVVKEDGRQLATNVTSADAPRESGVADRVASWLQRLSMTQISKEDVPYLEVITAFARDQNPAGAARWLDIMADAGQEPPVEAYNAVIGSYGKVGAAEEAGRWLARLSLRKPGPNLESYKHVLQSWAAVGDTEKVQELWQEIESKVVPDDECYCAVLRSFCTSGDATQVKAWLDRFEWEGISLNWETYTELIKFYISRGELQEAFELSEEVAEGDAFETGPGAWLRQLEAAADQGSTEQVEKVARAMHRYCGFLGKQGRGFVTKALSEERVEALAADIDELRVGAQGIEAS